MHASGLRGGDAGFGVFEDEASSGVDAEAMGGGEEGFGIGLAVGVVFGADEDFEAVRQAEEFQRFADGGAGRAGDDGEGDAPVLVVDMGEHGGDGLHGDEGAEVEVFLALGHVARGHLIAEGFVEDFDGAGEGDATEGVEEVFGEGAALFLDGLTPAQEMERHGVGYGAVEVEKVGLEGVWGNGEFGLHGFSVEGRFATLPDLIVPAKFAQTTWTKYVASFPNEIRWVRLIDSWR